MIDTINRNNKNMKYIGIKFVDAVPMTAEKAEKKGYRIGNNNGDGFEVTYDDGYKSWCPKDVFEKHNHPIKNEELAKTCELMMSPDYKERFKGEYVQLKNRLESLQRMIDAWDNGKLDFKPTCPRSLYDDQIEGMKLYLNVLAQRAEIERVEV